MRVVLVSSPGRSPAPHWSHAASAELARELLAGGADVEWFHTAAIAGSPPEPVGAHARGIVAARRVALHRVGAGMHDLGLERALADSLRQRHADAVLHVGLGAGGSPNVPWLADRMGSRVFAVVRSAEVVCQRGDLVDRTGLACTRHDDAATCRVCCTRAWWGQPHADEFRNRWDLLLGGLLSAEAVFVEAAEVVERLAALGVARRRLTATHDARSIAGRVLGRG
ncbi:MAG: hypothetical protein JNM25_08740 [Planctomycetes bacterium]|nr:hypothetical protein [Planctomycetota bacterium]